MQLLKFALMVVAFIVIATPVQAAQVCEAEIQEVLEAIKAGGNAVNLPQTREEAVRKIRDYTRGDGSYDLGTISKMKAWVDEDVALIQRLEKRISGELAPDMLPKMSEEELEFSQRGRRAELARKRLVLCAMEKKNAKYIKGSETSAASNGKPIAKTERTSSDKPAADNPGSPKAAIRDTPVQPVAAAPAGSPPNATGPLDPYAPAVRADFEYACAEEIKLAEATSPGQAFWVRNSWADEFKRNDQPGLYFEQIRRETTSHLIPYWYVRACAVVAHVVQRRRGVGSGKEALGVWHELRAKFEQSLATVQKKETTRDAGLEEMNDAFGGSRK